MSTIYEQDLDKCAANFVALSPVSFVERSAEVFADLPAVVNGTVIAANDDIASRWGPRIADFAVELSDRLGELH